MYMLMNMILYDVVVVVAAVVVNVVNIVSCSRCRCSCWLLLHWLLSPFI